MSITLNLSDELFEQLTRLSETTEVTIKEINHRGVQTQIDRPRAVVLDIERCAT